MSHNPPSWLWLSKPMVPFWLVGEFTTHFRFPILVVGLNWMFTGTIWIFTHCHIPSASLKGARVRVGGVEVGCPICPKENQGLKKTGQTVGECKAQICLTGSNPINPIHQVRINLRVGWPPPKKIIIDSSFSNYGRFWKISIYCRLGSSRRVLGMVFCKSKNLGSESGEAFRFPENHGTESSAPISH